LGNIYFVRKYTRGLVSDSAVG